MPTLTQLLNLKNINMVLRNIWKAGPIATAQFVISDLLFDFKYKVDTINTRFLDELDIDSPNKAHGYRYEGTNVYVFNYVFSRAQIDGTNSVFVDFGSGKGRAMIMAAERGFRKAIGVEFSAELVEICKKNLEIYRAAAKAKTQFEVVFGDAADFQIPADADFLYFANPFDEVLIAKVIARILDSLKDFPREITVMHLFPQGNRAFLDHPRMQLICELKYGYVFKVMPA